MHGLRRRLCERLRRSAAACRLARRRGACHGASVRAGQHAVVRRIAARRAPSHNACALALLLQPRCGWHQGRARTPSNAHGCWPALGHGAHGARAPDRLAIRACWACRAPQLRPDSGC